MPYVKGRGASFGCIGYGKKLSMKQEEENFTSGDFMPENSATLTGQPGNLKWSPGCPVRTVRLIDNGPQKDPAVRWEAILSGGAGMISCRGHHEEEVLGKLLLGQGFYVASLLGLKIIEEHAYRLGGPIPEPTSAPSEVIYSRYSDNFRCRKCGGKSWDRRFLPEEALLSLICNDCGWKEHVRPVDWQGNVMGESTAPASRPALHLTLLDRAIHKVNFHANCGPYWAEAYAYGDALLNLLRNEKAQEYLGITFVEHKP